MERNEWKLVSVQNREGPGFEFRFSMCYHSTDLDPGRLTTQQPTNFLSVIFCNRDPLVLIFFDAGRPQVHPGLPTTLEIL